MPLSLRMVLDRRRLPGDQLRRPERGDQDQRGQPDPLGDGGRRVEYAEALEAVPGQPVVDAEGAEGPRVGVTRPAQEQVGGRTRYDGREADAYFQRFE